MRSRTSGSRTSKSKRPALQARELDLFFGELVQLDLEGDVGHLNLEDTRNELGPARLEAGELCPNPCLERTAVNRMSSVHGGD